MDRAGGFARWLRLAGNLEAAAGPRYPSSVASPHPFRLATALLACTFVLPASSADAQSRRDTAPHPVGHYEGVGPEGGAPPRASAARRAATRRRGPARIVTWPGFQMRPDGSSRFFLQLTSNVSARVSRVEGGVEVYLPETRTHVSNTRRPLLTRWFNTPALSARVRRRGRRDSALVFRMRSDVMPRVSGEQRADGYYYLLIDFPAGDYIPEAERFVPGAAGGPTSWATEAEGRPGDRRDRRESEEARPRATRREREEAPPAREPEPAPAPPARGEPGGELDVEALESERPPGM